MLWRGGRQSRNIEDRRGLSVGRGVGVAGGGIGTIVIVVIALFLGVDPRVLLQGDGGGVPSTCDTPGTAPSSGDDEQRAFVATIAHEVGHHVQTLLGLMRRGNSGQAGTGGQSVRTELQADCFAGIWAHDADRTRRLLEKGDVEEALGAASAVGDDRLQRRSQGYVVPESFTHGTSAQGVTWFKRGFASGDLRRCDTSRSL